MLIIKNNGIPYYMQLAGIIEEKISSKLWSEGEQIPSESELSQICGLNRHTVRQAVDHLCSRGVLFKLRGRGTFVVRPATDYLEYKLSARNRFSENIRSAGKTPENLLLFCERIPAPGHVASALLIFEGDEVFHYSVLRKVDGQPFLLAVNYSPVQRLPGLNKHLPVTSSVFDIYHLQYDMWPRRVKTTFCVGLPKEEEIRLLHIMPGTPVLRVDSTLEASGALIQYTESCYRGDLAKLSIEWEGAAHLVDQNNVEATN